MCDAHAWSLGVLARACESHCVRGTSEPPLVSDLWTGRHDLEAALSAVKDDGAPVVLLTHNPDVFPLVPDRVTLTLAGHTHGGQVRLPFVGRPIVPSRFGQRFAAGHVVEGGRHLFVATGLGTSILPVRFRVPLAVAMLTLVSEQPLTSRMGLPDPRIEPARAVARGSSGKPAPT